MSKKIKLKEFLNTSGLNDCNFNIERKCINKKVTRRLDDFDYDWSGKTNCVYSQLGVHLCGSYKKIEV
jgi:hypothetical protein